MTTRDRLTLAAAAAVALASSALWPVFADGGWLLRVLGAVAAVSVAAALARTASVPRGLEPVAAIAGLSAYVIVVFARSTLTWGLVPTSETLRLLRDLVEAGLVDVQELGPPVPSRPGLVLLAVLGVGAVAVAVDLVAVVTRRAAAAGVPLLVLFAVPASVLPGGLGALPFLLGAVGWLGLLLADESDRAARWGTPLQTAPRRLLDVPSFGRTGRRIGVAALGVAVIVPALLPGLDGRLLGGVGGTGEGGARSTTTYNPLTRLAGQLRLPEPQRLLTYRSEDGAGDYLRLTTLDRFDEEGGWSSSELSGDVEDDAVRAGIPTPTGQNRTSTRDATTQITLTSRLDGPWLPVPFPPTEIDLPGPWIWDAEAETAFSTRAGLSDVDDPYIVRSTPLEPTGERLRRVTVAPSEILAAYAQPPQVSDFVREVIARTTADATTDYDRVVALQSLFRDPANGFRYSLDASAPGTNAPDALENFLRGQVGFCEQYASAMAAMTRALGIPARVAVGFLPGQQTDDGSYEVTTSEAHAWPEVWFRGAGWVRFEPTPRGGDVVTPAYSTPSVDAEDDQTPSPAGPAVPAQPETGPGASADELDRAGADGAAAPGEGQPVDGGPSPLLLAVPVVLVLGACPAAVAQLRRRRRLADPTPTALWSVLEDDALDLGHRWRPADSPRAAAQHLMATRRLPGSTQAALHRLAGSTEAVRFGRPGAVGTGAAVTPEAREDLSTVRAGLLSVATGGERWRARLLPGSTLRWVGGGLSGLDEQWRDRVERVRASLLRTRGDRAAGSGAGATGPHNGA